MARRAKGVTEGINEVVRGVQDKQEEEALIMRLYPKLKREAARQFARQRRGHTLQATALVNSAWMALRHPRWSTFKNRGEFFRWASWRMKDFLARYDRRKRTLRRGSEYQIQSFSTVSETPGEDSWQLLLENESDLMSMIDRLRQIDPDRADIAEATMVRGESCEAYASKVGMKPSTVRVRRDDTRAQFSAWLQMEAGVVN